VAYKFPRRLSFPSATSVGIPGVAPEFDENTKAESPSNFQLYRYMQICCDRLDDRFMLVTLSPEFSYCRPGLESLYGFFFWQLGDIQANWCFITSTRVDCMG
jgi:hypothetical protein